MARYAVAHVERDVSLGNRLVGDVTVTRRALHAGTDVRRMIELDVGRLGVAVHALPGEIDPFLRHRRDLLNARLVRRDGRMANQAGVDAWQPRLRSLRDALMTVLETGEPFLDVNVVRELNRL